MSRVFLIGLLMLLVGGAILWSRGYQPWNPGTLQAMRGNREEVSVSSARSVLNDIDSQLAQTIRSAADGGWQWQVGSEQAVNKLKAATLSAQVTTTPEELWQTFREQGSQAVLHSVAQQAEVSVNGVSVQAVNEARYQYCLGVVETYERR